MNRYCREWIQEWCDENGWTDLFKERQDYWAFPPHAVMPTPIPTQVLQTIKSRKGFSPSEKLWSAIAWVAAVTGAGMGYFCASPMPMVLAFALCALIFAHFDDE